MTWIFLPGMDGTGDLLAPVIKEMPRDDVCVIVRYSRARVCNRKELFSIAWESLPDFEDYILVAESFSGPFALEIASRKPTRLRGLVLVTTFASSPARGVRKLLIRLFARIAMLLTPPAFLVRSLMTGPDSTDEQQEVLRSTIRSVKSSVLASRLMMVLQCDLLELLPRIKVPTLVLGAKNDRLVPQQTTEQLCSGIAGSRLQWIEAPHLALFVKPRLAAETMQRFTSNLATQ
jgi:pimeloyl-ACP methyl ester carboxylesterase